MDLWECEASLLYSEFKLGLTLRLSPLSLKNVAAFVAELKGGHEPAPVLGVQAGRCRSVILLPSVLPVLRWLS